MVFLSHLNWKAMALRISSLFQTILGVSILIVTLKKKHCSENISCQFGMASGRGLSEGSASAALFKPVTLSCFLGTKCLKGSEEM